VRERLARALAYRAVTRPLVHVMPLQPLVHGSPESQLVLLLQLAPCVAVNKSLNAETTHQWCGK